MTLSCSPLGHPQHIFCCSRQVQKYPWQFNLSTVDGFLQKSHCSLVTLIAVPAVTMVVCVGEGQGPVLKTRLLVLKFPNFPLCAWRSSCVFFCTQKCSGLRGNWQTATVTLNAFGMRTTSMCPNRNFQRTITHIYFKVSTDHGSAAHQVPPRLQ